jgi:hypothetical protein
MLKLRHIRDDDKQYLLGAVAIPLVLWLVFNYRKRYSTKGMK